MHPMRLIRTHDYSDRARLRDHRADHGAAHRERADHLHRGDRPRPGPDPLARSRGPEVGRAGGRAAGVAGSRLPVPLRGGPDRRARRHRGGRRGRRPLRAQRAGRGGGHRRRRPLRGRAGREGRLVADPVHDPGAGTLQDGAARRLREDRDRAAGPHEGGCGASVGADLRQDLRPVAHNLFHLHGTARPTRRSSSTRSYWTRTRTECYELNVLVGAVASTSTAASSACGARAALR